MLVSAVQQSESAICIYVSPLFWISSPFRSSQSTEQRVPCALQQALISYPFLYTDAFDLSCKVLMVNLVYSTQYMLGRRQWQPTPVLLPGKSHGRMSLVGYSPWGREESDTTERLHFQFSLSCIGEGDGNPLQCSYLENPRDGGAGWAAIYGVMQSWTQPK